MVNPDFKPLRIPGILEKDMGKETLLYSAQDGAIHVLNKTARLIWSLCDGNHSLEQIESEIRSQFSIPSKVDLHNDVIQTLETFANKGLLKNTAS